MIFYWDVSTPRPERLTEGNFEGQYIPTVNGYFLSIGRKDLFYSSTEWIGKSPGMRFPDDDERMCDPGFLVFDMMRGGGGSKYCQKRQ